MCQEIELSIAARSVLGLGLVGTVEAAPCRGAQLLRVGLRDAFFYQPGSVQTLGDHDVLQLQAY